MTPHAYHYYANCVNWPQHDVDADGGLCDMVAAAIDVTRATFVHHVDRAELVELENALGYDHLPAQGLTMANDYHVSYHRSRLHDERVYFFKQSAIEYVFTKGAP